MPKPFDCMSCPTTDTNQLTDVVYHGTRSTFTDFHRPEEVWIGPGMNDTKVIHRIYFTESKEVANSYGHIVKQARLEMKNPLVLDAAGQRWATFHPVGYVAQAVNNGHDGIIIRGLRDDARGGGKPATTYIVFDPCQVKLVSDQSILAPYEKSAAKQVRPDSTILESYAEMAVSSKGSDSMCKLAAKEITGQLIQDPTRRAQWYDLVIALQKASEVKGGPLEGWVFHGTDGEAAAVIEHEGLTGSTAYVPALNDDWVESRGVHFGTANVAAFFAEDRIESRENANIELIIYGAPTAQLQNCGEFAADGQMLDVPLYSRLRTEEKDVFKLWEKSPKDWKACLQILETIVVLGNVPRNLLVGFKSAGDVQRYCQERALDSDQSIRAVGQEQKRKRLKI